MALVGRCSYCKNKNIAQCIRVRELCLSNCPYGLGFINICEHEFYAEKDFTKEEYTRQNMLAVAVIDNKRQICRCCGYEETK